jgi:hypothetical protein
MWRWGEEEFKSADEVEEAASDMLADRLDDLKAGRAIGPDGREYYINVSIHLVPAEQ